MSSPAPQQSTIKPKATKRQIRDKRDYLHELVIARGFISWLDGACADELSYEDLRSAITRYYESIDKSMVDHKCVRTGVSYECSCGWHIEGNTDTFKCNALISHIKVSNNG